MSQQQYQPKKKKVITRFELILLIGCLAVMVYFVLGSFGVKPVKKVVKTEWVENPGQTTIAPLRRTVSSQDEARDRHVDDVLKDISVQFTTDKNVVNRELRKKGLDRQEAQYLQNVKEKKESELGRKIESAKEWYNILKASHQTYSSVKNMFNDMGIETDEQSAVSKIFENKSMSSALFNSIEQQFAIPEEQSRSFAKQGAASLNAWADFVESNKSN